MSIKWGPSTWLLLHSLSFKVKEEEFDSVKLELIDIFKQMCFVLPCPYCQKHAKEYITSKDFNKIKSKQDFIDILWAFHNIVNVKTGKKLVNVFVPTTPNPTSGFLLMVPKEDLIFLYLTFEEASKFIVSAGTSKVN